MAEREGVALFDFDEVFGDAVVPFEDFEGFAVADDPDVGPAAHDVADLSRVVGFHVVDDQIIELSPAVFAEQVLDPADIVAAGAHFDGIEQGGFVVGNEV